MTEEEKQAAETAKAEAAQAEKEAADAAAAAAAEEGNEGGEAEKGKIDNEIDYEAEFKKEKEAREKAEAALAGKRFKNSEKKRKDEDSGDEDEDEEDDKPLTKKGLAELLAKNTQDTEKKLNQARAEEITKTMTSSDAEKNLVLEIHKNRTFPAHYTLQEQIEEAYVIANRKKIVGENAELKRALKGKDGVVKNPAGTHRDAPPGNEPKIAPQDTDAIKAAGYSWNGALRRWEKKFKNGDILVSDPKTKKTTFIKAQ